jgi:type I restriction enzyme S subunit
MELNKFKESEIGLIPEDWDIKNVGDCFNICNNLRLPISQEVRNTMQGIYPYYGPTKIQDYLNEYRVDGEYALIGEDGDHFLKWYTHSMTQLASGKFNVNNHAHLVKGNKKNTTTIWFYYFFKNRDITEFLTRQGAGRYKLSKAGLINLPCAFPKIDEQNAIAKVLIDIDDLIQAIEQKISKKRAIKDGAMKQLFTPKENWKVKILPEVCWFQEGPGVRRHQFTSKGVKLLNGTNIEKGNLLLDKTSTHISDNEANGWYSHFLVNSGDILIACSGITISKFEEKVTIANKKHLPLCMNTSTMRFKIKDNKLNKKFLFHFLKSDSFKIQIGGKATGSAQLNFGPSHVSKVNISYPKTNEQIQIATILSDMDAEIEQLEQKLSKYKMFKQGLMQNLLTGKIRLV